MTPDRTLRHRTVSALKWSYGATALQAILQIVLTVTLARLLSPRDFGLVAMATVAVRFGQYFAQMGLGQALVQSPEIDARDVRTTFTASLALGLFFAACTWLLAPAVAHLFHQPQVTALLRLLSLTFVANGFRVTSNALLVRHLRIRAASLIDVITTAVGYIGLSILLAALGAGPWSLAIASVTQAFLAAGVYYAAVRHSLIPTISVSSLRRLLGFGSRASVIGFLEFLCGNLDTVWAGRVFAAADVGLYNRAFNLVSLPLFYMTSSFSRVTVSAFSRIQFERDRLRRIVLPALTAFLAVAAPTFWGLAGASREVVLVLLGPKWSGVTAPMAVLALAAPFALSATLSAVLCEATAVLNRKLWITGSQVLVLCALLATLGRISIVGVAAAIAISQTWAAGWYSLAAARVLRCRLIDIVKADGPSLITGAAVGLVAGFLSLVAREGLLPVPLVLAIQIVAGAGMTGLLILRGFDGRIWAVIAGLSVRDRQLGEPGGLWYRIASRLDAWARTPAADPRDDLEGTH